MPIHAVVPVSPPLSLSLPLPSPAVPAPPPQPTTTPRDFHPSLPPPPPSRPVPPTRPVCVSPRRYKGLPKRSAVGHSPIPGLIASHRLRHSMNTLMTLLANCLAGYIVYCVVVWRDLRARGPGPGPGPTTLPTTWRHPRMPDPLLTMHLVTQ